MTLGEQRYAALGGAASGYTVQQCEDMTQEQYANALIAWKHRNK